jgi:hypothetical protein
MVETSTLVQHTKLNDLLLNIATLVLTVKEVPPYISEPEISVDG